MKKNLLVLVFTGAFVLTFPFLLSAETYNIYVDSSFTGDDSDGSQEKPYSKLSDAAKGASGNQTIYLKNGEYSKAEIGKSVKIIGQSKKAIIKGTLTLSGNNHLENLTVSNGSPSILISKNSDVTIDDCQIENFQLMGIQALPGGGNVIIKNSSIHGRGGKGIYIQEGRNIEISGNEIYDTGGEGLDIRARVSGKVFDNAIYGNSESGIEFVTGSSNINISGNNIKNNGASAIASQFYRGTSKTGKIVIQKNVMSKNKKFGLDCAFPSGGEPSSEYWGDSIELIENTIEGNKLMPISNVCHMSQAVDEEEKEKNDISQTTKEDNEKTASNQNERSNLIEEEEVVNFDTANEKKLNENIRIVLSRNIIKAMFFGPDYSSINNTREQIEKLKIDQIKLFILLRKTESKENKKIVRERIAALNDKIISSEKILAKEEKKISFFGWIARLLDK
ncbi:MAG TPA: right-handed parallel beta-helix repeat-containing protein [Patescibacteria group bacterium]|nr:right-handed parallel beta-helix repeat-containing protein [Patescibacteria group bacterium]